MDVSVIMINYNTFSLTKDALDSIFRETKGIDYEVILIDNASPDGSGDRLSALYGNKIVYLQSGGNLGTSKAFNIALKHEACIGQVRPLAEHRYSLERKFHQKAL